MIVATRLPGKEEAWLQICDLLFEPTALPFRRVLIAISGFLSLFFFDGRSYGNKFYVVEMIWIFPAVLDVWWIMGIRSLFLSAKCNNNNNNKELKKKRQGKKKEGGNIFSLDTQCFLFNEENK